MAEDTPLYFDCMNESGLAAGGLLFAGFAEYEAKSVEGKLNVTAYELPLWVCRNFTTVDQAQASLEHVAIVGAISSAEQRAALDKLIDRRLRDAALPCPFLGKGSVILRKEGATLDTHVLSILFCESVPQPQLPKQNKQPRSEEEPDWIRLAQGSLHR